ncbi:MAG: glutathione S-transferase family protein [Proteobacteria bacterium]|nr:glutathione S-transferase family protein [Pseudomonadota bacterium]
MADYKLYLGNKNYSSWSLRAWLVMKQCGVPFDEEVVPLREVGTQTAILRHSPSGRLPALAVGELTIWESVAIAEYLAERFTDAKLWPADRAARAAARACSAEMHAGFAELRQAVPMNCRHPAKPKSVSAPVRADIDRMTAIWAACRARYGGGGALLFGEFTIPDAMFAPEVLRLTGAGIELPAAARTYADAVLALPALAEWQTAAAVEPWLIPEFEL